MSARQALWGLIALSTLLRLIWATALGPCQDEAYYSLFAVHLDWSYYDHPPLMALIEAAGLGLAGGVNSVLALRLGFLALFVGSTLVMARLAARLYSPWASFLAAFLLNVTAYYGIAAATLALPDGPLVFFWLWTLDRLAAALETPDRLRPWVWVGLAWGGALLSKYHAVFLPIGAALYCVLEPSARCWLRRPGPYLALALGLLAFTPVIAWNARHGWVSFAFQGERALGAGFRPDALLGAIIGPAMYLTPWIWAFLVAALVRHARRFAAAAPADRFLLCQAIPPLLAFLLVACWRPVLPHWSLIGFLALLPLLGRDWAAWWEVDPAHLRRRLRWLAVVPVAGGLLFLGQARWGLLQRTCAAIGLPAPGWDPTAETFGWDQVARELDRRGLTNRPGTFLFTSKWYHSGQLAFALNHRAPVLCYNPRGAHHFAFWSRPEQWVGRDGILVVVNESSTEPDMFDRWFHRIEPLGAFAVVRAGVPIWRVRLYHCVRQTRPFPYDRFLPHPTPQQVAYQRSLPNLRDR
ncbi:MAG: glycosyltransferase family 39 protein [Isosphaeraceae bacterium]|nr:glycosyltransferase family 39 protein [Isosphaeraceae bacterium]